MKWFLPLVFAALVATPFISRGGVIIGALASPRQGELALVGGGALGTSVANYITTRYPDATIVGTQELTPAFVATVDILILNSASGLGIGTLLSSDEQTAVLNFVKSGGGAIIAADGNPDWAGDSFGAPFGVTTGQATTSTGRFVELDHPVARGPFGTITQFTIDPLGDPDAFVSTGAYATVIARAGIDGTGPPIIASIPENRIGPGSGRVVFYSDAVIPGWSALTDDGLLLNSIEYVMGVPEPSSMTTAGLGIAALLMTLHRWKRVTAS